MTKGKTVHIISHTHWDREWYINSPYLNEWLPDFFNTLFSRMQQQPEYQFTLDGQVCIIEDCRMQIQKLGGDITEFDRLLSRFVSEGRLAVGPYYLQPDWLLISDEALVRNLLIGSKICNEIGARMNMGWLPDNFGQISQAPQIHRQFGIKGIFTWRGVEIDPNLMSSEFYWESPDGTKLPCIYLLNGYRNAIRLCLNPPIAVKRIHNEATKLESFAHSPNILLMNGFDQDMNPDDILPVINDPAADFGGFTVKQSLPEEYWQAVFDTACGHIPSLKGSLRSGRFISVFPGVLSARMNVKQRNDAIQRAIEQQAEPLATMALMAGLPYPHQSLEQAWKLLLKNHPHDSICGVSVDSVYHDMEQRYLESGRIANQIKSNSISFLAANIDTTAFSGADAVFTVFNTALHPRRAIVELPVTTLGAITVRDADGKVLPSNRTTTGILVDAEILAAGFVTLGIYREKSLPQENLGCMDNTMPTIENESLIVSFNKNGTLNIFDKRSGKRFNAIAAIEDGGDNGDEYNYSNPLEDSILSTSNSCASVELVENNSLRSVVKISTSLMIPQLIDDMQRNKRSKLLCELPIVTFVEIEKHSSAIKFETHIRNTAKDHRLRVVFPTEIACSHSFSQTQFDVVKNPIVQKTFSDDDIPENVKRIILGARETVPITQFPQKEFCAIQDGTCGAAVLVRGLPEYEILEQDSTIAITLLRSVGWLARGDLNTRVGDARPQIRTPDAQCLGDHVFNYAFLPFCGDWQADEVMRTAQDFGQEMVICCNTSHSGKLSPIHSFAKLTGNANLRVTAFKAAQDKDAVLVRLYNPTDCEHQAKLMLNAEHGKVLLCDLAENALQELAATPDFSVKPGEIATLLSDCGSAHDLIDYPCAQISSTISRAPDFTAYPLPKTVTPDDLELEKQRSSKTKIAFEAIAAEIDERICENNKTPQDEYALAKLELERESLKRVWLEAELSSLLYEQELLTEAQKSCRKEICDDIRNITKLLCESRIRRRANEYILELRHFESLT